MIRPNDCIGPYTLLEKLGRGAFGVVWLAAKRTALTEHKVALKLPAAEEVDLDAIRQEAIVWEAAKGHPNIVPIIEADIYDGQVVIASEYVPDGSLADWLQRHGGAAPGVEAAVALALGILAGLEHLHARRIVHRDLKPANILLQAATPRLADFGLARCLKSTNSSSTVSGTFAYMAPEAFDGRRMEQSDLWAVGVMLYQMLTGRLPFPQTDSPALLAAILTKEPEPLPDQLPAALQAVLARALRKDPQERYGSAAEMSNALRAAYQGPGLFSSHPGSHASDATLIIPTSAQNVTVPLFAPPSLPQVAPATAATAAVVPTRTLMESPALRSALVVIAVVLLLVTAGVALSRRWWPTESAPPVPGQKSAPAPRKTGPVTPLDGKTAYSEELSGGVKLEMAVVPAGRFTMGAKESEGRSEREGPEHEVVIKRPFYLGRYELTQAQWMAVMGDNPARFTGDPQRPVENINWIEAQEFCRRLSDMTGRAYRLPTEAEWEYAARAGTSSPYAGDLDSLAWYDANSGGASHPVGQKQPNAFGLSDMHGNVGEWCEDVWHDNYKDAPADGSSWLNGGDAGIRIIRGGAWGNSLRLLRSAYRSDNFGADVRSNLVGLRVAMDAPAK